MATILVVDDRPTNRQFLLTLLGYTNHRVLDAADGAEALDVARADRPDLVITDILMSTMDGYEFVLTLRKDPSFAKTPIIFYSATYSTPEAELLAKSCGVNSVLRKPCEPREILAAVDQALGTSKSEAESLAVPAMATVATGRDLDQVGDQASAYLNDLRAAGAMFDEIFLRGSDSSAVRERVRTVSEKFSTHIANLQRFTSRLSTLIEIAMDAMSEHDPARMVEKFFSTACKIVGSSCAAVGVLDQLERSPKRLFTKGIDAAIYDWAARVGLPGSLSREPRFLRLSIGESESRLRGLPTGHPPVESFMGGPIVFSDEVHGWIYFTKKPGEEPFSEEDERIGATLAAMLAMLYEHVVLYDTIQRHAARLQIEVAERRRAEQNSRESEAKFRQMAENIRDVFFLIDVDNSRMHYVSPAYEEIWGRSCESLYADPRSWAESIHPDDRAYALEKHTEGMATGGFDYEYRIVRPDGAVRWIHARGFPVRDEAGKPYRTAGVAEDITARREAQEKIKRLNRVYAVLSGINGLIVRVRDREELYRGACRIAVEAGEFRFAWVGVVDSEAMQLTPVAWHGVEQDFLAAVRTRLSLGESDPKGRSLVAQAVLAKEAMISNDVANDPRIQFKQEHKERGIQSLAAFPLMVSDAVVGVLALHAAERGFFVDEEMRLLTELAGDISFALEHIDKAEKLNYLAYYDSLTGLANRELLHERLTQSVRSASRDQRKLALIVLDIERFKAINDSFGRQAGDELLKQFAAGLVRVVGDPTRIARVSGDHFTAVLRGSKVEDEVARFYDQRLREYFAQPFKIENHELRISAKAGIAIFPNDGADAEALFRNAEAALKKAKASGEPYLFYTQQMTERIAERLALENKLRLALEKQEFVLHYQPKFDAETNRIEGVEALIRWQSSELGLVPPMQFIPLLEETGLIFEVGAWALRQAAFDHRRWRKLGLSAPRVAVNVSPIQLRRRDFVESVRKVLGTDTGAPPVDLEITESLIMEDVKASIEKLEEVRLLGVEVAIDDFGTGYSSLGYLAKLPVQTLKIDRSFIITMLGDAAVMTLVSTIISMAHSLRLKVVAEGVDSEDQAGALKRLGCDQMQGFLFSKPLPFDEMTALLGPGAGKRQARRKN